MEQAVGASRGPRSDLAALDDRHGKTAQRQVVSRGASGKSRTDDKCVWFIHTAPFEEKVCSGYAAPQPLAPRKKTSPPIGRFPAGWTSSSTNRPSAVPTAGRPA